MVKNDATGDGDMLQFPFILLMISSFIFVLPIIIRKKGMLDMFYQKVGEFNQFQLKVCKRSYLNFLLHKQ